MVMMTMMRDNGDVMDGEDNTVHWKHRRNL